MPRMTLRRILSGLSLAAILALPALAAGADPPAVPPGAPSVAAKAEASRLALDGRKALKEKRFSDAAQALKSSDQLDPNPETKLSLAEALAGDDKLLEASRILHAVADAPANPATAKAQEAAKKSLGEIEPRIPWLLIEVAGPPEGTATVRVDGKEVDATNEIPLNPGNHKISVEAEGFAPKKKTVHLDEGVHDKTKLKLKAEGAAKPPKGEDDGAEVEDKPAATPDSSSPSIFSPSSPKFPAMLSFYVGGASLIAGSISGLVAVTKASSARKYCTGNVCTPAAADDIASSKAAGTASTIFFIATGVAAGTGVTLWIVLPNKKSPAAKPKDEATTEETSNEEEEPKPKPKKKKKKKKPVEEEEAPSDDARIGPFIGLGQVGVRGVF